MVARRSFFLAWGGPVAAVAAVLLLAATGLAPQAAAQASFSPWTGLVASNQYPADRLSTFGPVQEAFGENIDTGGDTVWVQTSADGRSAYATTVYPGRALETIDVASGTVSSSVPLSDSYFWGAVSPDGRLLYLSGEAGEVLPVDLTTDPATPGTAIPLSGSAGVAFAPDGRTAYVANGKGIVPIDVATGKAGSEIPTGEGAIGVAVSPDGSTVWVTNRTAETVTAVDARTLATRQFAVAGHPRNLAVSPDGSRVWVGLEAERELTWIDVATGKVGTPVEIVANSQYAAEGLAVSPDGSKVFVSDGAFNGSGQGQEVFPVAVGSDPPKVGPAIPESQFVDPVWLAIAPDQGPTSNFTVASQPAGSPTSFDASSSLPGSTPTVSYAWDFGDGAAAVTATPVVTHVYAQPGRYQATVTETDAAGTSTEVRYTGQQAIRNGSLAAVATRSVVVGEKQPQVSLSSLHLDFGTVGVHQPQPTLDAVLTNTGQGPLHVGTVRLEGAQATQFSLAADSCQGATVPVGGSCSATVRFAPTGGAAVGQLVVEDDASGSPHTVLLTGEGTDVGSVRGTVTSEGALGPRPLAGAQVIVCTAVTRSVCKTAATDSGGAYAAAGLPAGRYGVEVFPPQGDLGAGSATVAVAEGAPTVQDFTLSPPQTLSHGVSFDSGGGSTASGTPTVRWDEPFSFQVPVPVPASGPPNGLKLVTAIGTVTLHAGDGGNGGFGAAATERLLVSYDAQGHASSVIGVEDDSGAESPTADASSLSATSTAPPGRAASGRAASYAPAASADPRPAARVAKGLGKLVKEVKEGYEIGKKIGEQISERYKYSRDKQGNEVAEIKQPLPGGSSINQTFYKRPNGQEGTFTHFEFPDVGSLCEQVPSPPVKKLSQEASEALEKLAKQISKSIQEGEERAGKALPEAMQKAQEAIKQAQDKWNADPNNPIGKAFSPPVAGVSRLRPSSVALLAPPVGSQASATASASASFQTADMSSTLLYRGHAYGEGWPTGGLPLAGGGASGLAVQFSLPSLQQRVHGEMDWQVQIAVDPVRISNEAVAAASSTDCNESRSEFGGNGYIDPSGTVLARDGAPLAGAKVVLLRSTKRSVPARPVHRGSTAMSPANRRNPDRTDALGQFGWDVLPGFYRVVASHPGCGPAKRTRLLPVPPAVLDLRLVLGCRPRRARTRIGVSAHRRGAAMVTLTARVRSARRGRLLGFVSFRVGARAVAQATVSPRGVAVVTVRISSGSARVLAVYSGDALHAPARARAR